MTQSFRAILERDSIGNGLHCALSGLPTSAIGHDATFTLRTRVKVKRASGVDGDAVINEHKLKLQSTTVRLPVEDHAGTLYRYAGKQIDIQIAAKLEIDDGIVFDSRLETELDVPLRKLAAAEASASLIDPVDKFSLAANLRAVSPVDRMIVHVLLAIGGIVSLGNAAIGVHDEFVPESQTIWYDHSGSDGSESPTVKSLLGSGGVGLAIWAAVFARLRRYMRISLQPGITTPRRGERIAARNLVDGTARVALEQSTLRVVAANRELGQYREKSGKETKTRSFAAPVQAIVLFEQFLPHVPAGSSLADHLDGDVDFDPIFTSLHPPLMAGSNHGIDIVWEVQLLHPEFVDQELIGPNDWIATDWQADANSP